MQTSAFIHFDGVSKMYSQGHETIFALRDVSLDIQQGELVAVMGPSGAGKTTLAHILGGLTTPSSGWVSVDGKKMQQRSDRALSRYRNTAVGFVFQSFRLLPHYTVLENVAVPLVIAGIPLRKRILRAQHYLQLVGLEHRADQRADELSGGEQQRVAIARALVQQPRIIIADEPTGSLDSVRGHKAMDILVQLCRQEGGTILVVTHDETVARRADRIIHIYDGRVREGKHAYD